MRQFLADTIAMVVFSTALGLAAEVLSAGLAQTQSLRLRVIGIILSLLLGAPYGPCRDAILSRFPTRASWQRVLADTFANVSFQGSVYLALLLLMGITLRPALVACVSVLVMAGLTGRPYGRFVDLCRRIFRARGRSGPEVSS